MSVTESLLIKVWFGQELPYGHQLMFLILITKVIFMTLQTEEDGYSKENSLVTTCMMDESIQKYKVATLMFVDVVDLVFLE